VKPSA